MFLVYFHFESEKCFKKEARDFIALMSERKEVGNVFKLLLVLGQF